MFEGFDLSYQSAIYRGLRELLDSPNLTSGFHNGDKGHPVYGIGAIKGTSEGWEYADSPERNRIFIMLSELSVNLRGTLTAEDRDFVDLSNWQTFCKHAVAAHEKRMEGLG